MISKGIKEDEGTPEGLGDNAPSTLILFLSTASTNLASFLVNLSILLLTRTHPVEHTFISALIDCHGAPTWIPASQKKSLMALVVLGMVSGINVP